MTTLPVEPCSFIGTDAALSRLISIVTDIEDLNFGTHLHGSAWRFTVSAKVAGHGHYVSGETPMQACDLLIAAVERQAEEEAVPVREEYENLLKR